MREILFRGKCPDDNEWVYGYIGKDSEGNWCMGDDDGFGCDIIPSTIGQFTGLTDKNGVKIFEGDIVAIPPFMSRKGTFGIVKFGDYKNSPYGVDDTNRGFYIHWRYEDNEAVENLMRRDIVFWCQYSHVDIMVIGNIHDAPEILEATE